MKWLFIVVALLNIIYGAYNLFVADNSDENVNLAGLNDKSQLIILNELDASALKELQDKVIPSKAIIDEIEQSSPSEELSINEVQDDSEKTDILNRNTDENNLCYKLGPFTKDIMNDIRQILETEYQNQLSFGIETTSDITYYRIYIPPLNDKDKIKETLSLLDENGLKDHYVMSIDGRKNAIALGVFKLRSAAEKVARKSSKIGLSTTIEAISDDKNSLYQLLVIFQADQNITRFNNIISEKELLSVMCDK